MLSVSNCDLPPIPQVLTMLSMKPAMLSVTYYLFPSYWLIIVCYPWSRLCYQWLTTYSPDIDYAIHEASFVIRDLLPIPQVLTMLSMKPAMLAVTYYLFPRYWLCYQWSQLCYQGLITYSPDSDYVIHEASYVISDLLPIPQIVTMLSMKPAMLLVSYYLFPRYGLCYPWSQLC